MFIAISDGYDNSAFLADTLEDLRNQIVDHNDELDMEDYLIFEGSRIEVEVTFTIKKVETAKVTKKIAGNGNKIPK